MLKENKNRGAGLVTVVVVLAVSSILLSASIWLSFNHYRNVMTAETYDEELAELDLCAELVCMAVNRDNSVTIDKLVQSTSELRAFYQLTENAYNPETNIILIAESAECTLQLFDKDADGDFKNGLTIQCLKNGEVIAEETYVFVKPEGSFVYVAALFAEQDTPEVTQ